MKRILISLLLIFAICSAPLIVSAQTQKTADIGTVNSQTGTSYTFTFSDRGKLVTFSNGSAVSVALPQATAGGNFRSGWTTFVYNLGAGTVTITPTTSTINGSASIALATGEGATIFSNGSNYLALRTSVAVGGGGGIGNVTGSSLTAGQLIVGNGSSAITTGNLSGDVTTSGSTATTIASSAVTTAKIASKSGNGTTVGTTSGSTSNGKCLEWDVNGNIVTAASNAACGSGSGSGTVNSGVAGKLAAYPSTGTTVDDTADADSISSPVYCADAGANDTYACNLSPAPSAYTTGTHYRIKVNTSNTGAATLNLNALGAKSIKIFSGAAKADPADNDLRAGGIYDFVYDGTDLLLQSTLGNTSSGGSYAGVTTGGTGSLDMAQGTKTANEPWIDATGTWNSSGVTFEGITLNATDTASASGSLLLNLKRSNSTIFSVGKTGAISIPNSGSTITIAQNGSYGFQSGATITSGPSSGASSGTTLFSTTWASTSRDYTASSGSTNNPDFGANAYLYRITPNAAGSTLTGGRDIVQTTEMHEAVNVGSAPLILSNNSSSSSSGRRWLTASNLNLQLAPNQKAPYLYDSTSGNLRIGKFESSETVNVTTQFDKTNTTLADVTGLSQNVSASRTYNFTATLYYDADITGGAKFAIGGTATATAIIYQVNTICNASNLNVITSRQTALAGSAGQAGCTAGYTEVSGTITVNAAGTLTVQFAQNAASGTSSVLVGSTFYVNNIN